MLETNEMPSCHVTYCYTMFPSVSGVLKHSLVFHRIPYHSLVIPSILKCSLLIPSDSLVCLRVEYRSPAVFSTIFEYLPFISIKLTECSSPSPPPPLHQADVNVAPPWSPVSGKPADLVLFRLPQFSIYTYIPKGRDGKSC